MAWVLIAISVGAGLGALSRYYLTLLWIKRQGNRFPYGTLFVNLTGAFVMGLLTVLVARFPVHVALEKGLLVGFLGSYTTFSSYILDTVNLWRDRDRLISLAYWLGSVIVGMICLELGRLVGRPWA